MSTEFLPFLPPSAQNAPSGEFHARIISPGAEKLSGSLPSMVAPPAASTKPKCDPTVTVERVGDRVTRIQVQCSCGEVIELSCVY